MKAITITVDMDSISEYAMSLGVGIHAEDPLLMYRKPLDRFTQFCENLQATATVFVISRDVIGPAVDKLKTLVFKGFEIASHSHNHNLKIATQQPGDILKDIRQSKTLLESTLEQPIVGFRAPGYHLSSNLLQELIGLGFQYDSSVIPSTSYYVARAISLLGQKLSFKQTRNLLASPQLIRAPRMPYRPNSNPYEGNGEANIIELPLAVGTPLGLPLTPSLMLQAPKLLRNAMLDSLASQPSLVLGLQIMDFVDPKTDGLPTSLQRKYPGFQSPVEERLEKLTQWVKQISSNRIALTCTQLAEQFN